MYHLFPYENEVSYSPIALPYFGDLRTFAAYNMFRVTIVYIDVLVIALAPDR